MMDFSTRTELESADQRRIAAAVAKDRAALESLLDESLRYIHSSGTDEDRATYVERCVNGHYDYQSIQVLSREWRQFGDVALCNGDARIEVRVQGTPKSIATRFLQVWRRSADGWRMASWQSTPIPAN